MARFIGYRPYNIDVDRGHKVSWNHRIPSDARCLHDNDTARYFLKVT